MKEISKMSTREIFFELSFYRKQVWRMKGNAGTHAFNRGQMEKYQAEAKIRMKQRRLR